MKLVSMLDEELFLDIAGKSRREVYTALLEKLSAFNELALDIPAVVDEMLEREKITGSVFRGVAMPHVRIAELHDLFIAVGLPADPEAMGGAEPEHLVIMAIIGGDMSDVYLKMLSTIARHLHDPAAAQQLRAAAAGGKAELWQYLANSDIKMREIVTAEDVMSEVSAVLFEDDLLSAAFDMFSKTQKRFLPVVDKSGRLVGELSARTVIRSFFPEYVFMMEHMNFLNDFAVFNEIFSSEHSAPVREYMNKEPLQVKLDTPLIQATLLIARQEAGDVCVVDEENQLCGVFSVENIINKVLRG